MPEVDQLTLWKVLEEKGTDEQRQMVRGLVDHAAPILDRIIETFPTYTLHNREHARNVVELMAKLLGESVKDLTPLEAAFLILAAYWHDIGMVFKAEERARLTEEPEWGDFLQNHAEAYLAVNGDPKSEPPLEIAEWYCRWRHADRVFAYLNGGASQGLSFRWGVVDLRETLGNLCRSHNEGIDRIQANPVLKTDFRAGEADLRFCVILLRLADILDFDRTRSPESVYQFLGLKRRSDRRKRASDVEWQKHLAAEGFVFPDDRSRGYALDFIAGPDHPAVEHDLRQFLDVIEGEIEHCTALLPTCSTRWREFLLPARIRRESIVANGYRYGEYRFSLDHDRVLELFMGENLYDDPYVFVREMLQNALDASRLREHFERLRGQADFKAQPIRVSEWVDRDRYRWVRFDDFGTGMDEQMVRDYLLKVGSSYYTSAQYEADKLRASKGADSDFVPISRFGIGLLSCFIAGDRVEISSLRQLPDGSRGTPVRLLLNGLHGFYTLQTPDLRAAPMPTGDLPGNDEPGYRSDFGTSIAIRLDPRKERDSLDLQRQLEQHLLCPPVPVTYQGKRIGGDQALLLDSPWSAPSHTKLSPTQLLYVERALRTPIGPDDIVLRVCSLDITRHSFTPKLKGQIVLRLLTHVEGVVGVASRPSGEFDLLVADGLKIRFEFLTSDIIGLRLTHNGVILPFGRRGTHFDILLIGSTRPHHLQVAGILAFLEYFSPTLDVSRTVLTGLPWKAYSAINLALCRSLARSTMPAPLALIDPLRLSEEPLMSNLLVDHELSIDGSWAALQIFRTERGLMSLKEILYTNANVIFEVLRFPGPDKTPN